MGNLPQIRAKCLVKMDNSWQYLQSPPGPRLYFWGSKSPNPVSDQIQKANPTSPPVDATKTNSNLICVIAALLVSKGYSPFTKPSNYIQPRRWNSQFHQDMYSSNNHYNHYTQWIYPRILSMNFSPPSSGLKENRSASSSLASWRPKWSRSGKAHCEVSFTSHALHLAPVTIESWKWFLMTGYPGQQHACKHDSCHFRGSTQRLKVESNTSHSPSQHPSSSPDSHPLMPRHHRSQGSTIHRNVFPMVPLCQSTAKSVLRVSWRWKLPSNWLRISGKWTQISAKWLVFDTLVL